MDKTCLRTGEAYRIRPQNIDTSRPLRGAFHSQEARTSAAIIVKFCSQRQPPSWGSFALSDLAEATNSTPALDHLREAGYVVISDGTCHVTMEFVEECFLSRPKSM